MPPLPSVVASNAQHSPASASIIKSLQHAFRGPVRRRRAPSPVEAASLKAGSSPAKDLTAWRRNDIISEDLCDDVIRYLARSLEPYKGATIVDVNPGACVWSRKLHDYLKPKCHLLMEPELRYVKPFISPLLEAPGSTYKHIALAGAHEKSYWNNWLKVLNDPDLLPPRQPSFGHSPSTRHLDTTFLVTGNLWRHSTSSRHSAEVKLASMVLGHTAWAAHTKHLFHQAGLVRMLWWMPNAEVPDILPSDVSTRHALNNGLELTSDIVQVVGCRATPAMKSARALGYQRHASLENESIRDVQQRMADQKIKRPNGRQLLLATTRPKAAKTPPGPNPLELTCTTCDDLARLLAEYESRKNKMIPLLSTKERVATNAKDLRKLLKPVVKYTYCIDVFTSFTNRVTEVIKWTRVGIILMDLLLDLIHLEAEWCQLRDKLGPGQEEPLQKLREQLLMEDEHWYGLLRAEFRHPLRDMVQMQAAHVLARHTSPSPVTRDARPYEPLKAGEDEFWPANSMSLVDVSPRSVNLGIEGLATSSEVATTCRQLLASIFIYSASSITKALDHMAPNAAADLIPQVPEITDPRYGGRLNPERVLARTLSKETILKLTHAYLGWPFRPEAWQLELATADASSAPGEDREEVDEGFGTDA